MQQRNRTAADWLAEKENLALMCAEGKTLTQIATQYNVETAVLGQVFDALGLRTLRASLRDTIRGKA